LNEETKTYILLIVFNILILLTNSVISDRISTGLSSFFSAVSKAGEKLSDFHEELSYRIRSIKGAYKYQRENEGLKRKLLLLRLENLKLKQELERMQAFTRISRLNRRRWKCVVAKVINLNPENKRLRFFIDTGKREGVREFLPVIDLNGNVVGKTVEPIGYSTAAVEPITSPSSSIGGKIKEGIGVLKGTGTGLLFLDYIYITRNPSKGEIVFTSGFDGIFPEGLPIGTISRVRRRGFMFLHVEVKPGFSISNIKYVGVLLKW